MPDSTARLAHDAELWLFTLHNAWLKLKSIHVKVSKNDNTALSHILAYNMPFVNIGTNGVNNKGTGTVN